MSTKLDQKVVLTEKICLVTTKKKKHLKFQDGNINSVAVEMGPYGIRSFTSKTFGLHRNYRIVGEIS